MGQSGQEAIRGQGKVEVTLVLLDTIVTDRKGAPIRGLTAADFELLVDNSLSPIEAIEERCAPAPAGAATNGETAATRPAADRDLRHLILFFDFAHMKSPARTASLRSALQFVETLMTPSDRAMVLASAKGSLSIVSPFTGDRVRLAERIRWMMDENSLVDTVAFEEENTIDRLQRQYGGPRRSADRTSAPRPTMTGLTPPPGECIAESRMAEANAMRAIRALANTMPAFTGVPGRKALVFFSETLRARPTAAYLDSCRISMFDHSELGLTVLPEMADLIEKANLAGVSFYPVHAGGMSDGPAGFVMSDALGFQQSVALSTGGQAFILMNNAVRVFEQAASDLSCNYVLFYRPPEAFRAGRHVVEVRVKRKGVRVRHRESFSLLTTEEASEEQMRAALSTPGLYRDLPVEGHGYSLADADRGRRRFLIQASVPVGALSLIPTGPDSSKGGVLLRGGVISKEGKLVCEFSRTVPLEAGPAPDASPRRAGIQALCTLPEGDHEIIVAARDESGGAMGTFWGKTRIRLVSSGAQAGTFLWARPARETWLRDDSTVVLPAAPSAGAAAMELPMVLRHTALLAAGERAAITYTACALGEGSAPGDGEAFVRLDGPQRLHLPAHRIDGDASKAACALFEATLPPGAFPPGDYTATPEATSSLRPASGPLNLKVE